MRKMVLLAVVLALAGCGDFGMSQAEKDSRDINAKMQECVGKCDYSKFVQAFGVPTARTDITVEGRPAFFTEWRNGGADKTVLVPFAGALVAKTVSHGEIIRATFDKKPKYCSHTVFKIGN